MLKEKLKALEEHIKSQDIKIEKLENDKKIFDALVKLHECNALVNKEFRKQYIIYFGLKKYDNSVPNIGNFINDPPTDENDLAFWNDFLKQYSRSDDVQFRQLYCQMNNDRSNNGAHVNVVKLTKNEFDELLEIAYPIEYKTNTKLYNEYRDWLFMFPTD